MESDDELMALVGKRDRAAYGRLLSSHLASVHRYLMRLTGSAADADELSQETFLRLWQYADRYHPGKVRFSTWLHRIAHNLAIDELRRRRTDSLDDPDALVDPGADPEDQYRQRQLGAALDRAIGTLPANQRAALLLCHVQGFSNHDAAGIMGIGLRALESLIARARRTLRERLAGSAPLAESDEISTQ